jgi:hypothetical protein
MDVEEHDALIAASIPLPSFATVTLDRSTTARSIDRGARSVPGSLRRRYSAHMADAPSPRLFGRLLQLVSRVLAAPAAAPLRLALGALVIEKRLQDIDFEAEGDPLPMFEPPPYRSHVRGGGRAP